jgi:HAD superfamily hydrolase (TIGR01509 family)
MRISHSALPAFPFEAVLWDMDGTLVDSEPIWIEEERKMMNALGVNWSENDALHCIGGPLSRVDEYMRLRSGNVHQPYELTDQLILRMIERLANGVKFAPGAKDLIDEMHKKGIPMALVSASTRAIVDAALDSIGREYFHITVSNDDVNHSKPDPEGYLKAAEFLGVDIRKSLILEDSLTGVTAGINAGANVLAIPHFVDLPAGERIIQISTLFGIDMNEIARLYSKEQL